MRDPLIIASHVSLPHTVRYADAHQALKVACVSSGLADQSDLLHDIVKRPTALVLMHVYFWSTAQHDPGTILGVWMPNLRNAFRKDSVTFSGA